MKERVIENTQRKYKQSSLWAGTEPKQEKRNQMPQNVVFTGILVAVLHQVLMRAGREEQAMLTTLAGLVVVLFWVIQYISQLFDTVQTLFQL